MTKGFEIANHAVTVTGRFLRVARLRDEYYDRVSDPATFIRALNSSNQPDGDLFTFLQTVADPEPRHSYHLEYESAAVLPLTTYDHWWKKQVNDKTRNMVRKGGKVGVEIREVAFTDQLVEGIVRIYNESPLRQGRRFRHYGKPLEQIRDEHSSFLDRSEFFGAFFQGELIGFIKLVHGDGVSNLMQIISMMAHRDKAPTNGLLAKAVERCTERRVPLLHYGAWSRRSMGDFKKHHAFIRLEVPRYYVPLTATGALALRMGFHRDLVDRIPESWLDQMAEWRTRWNYFRHSEGGIKVSPSRSASTQPS